MLGDASPACLFVKASGAVGRPHQRAAHDTEEAQVARAIVDQTRTLTVLADASKFDRSALFEVAPWSAVTRLIVDRAPTGELARRLEQSAVDVIVA